MIKYLINIGFVLIAFHCSAGFDSKIDSLLNLLEKENQNAALLNKIALEYQREMPDKSFKYANDALEIATNEKNINQIAVSNTLIGVFYYYKEQMDSALHYLLKADSLKKHTDYSRIGLKRLSTISLIYEHEEDNLKAIKYSKKALEVCEKNEDKLLIYKSLNNIGYLYRKLDKYDTAKIYLEKALDYKLELGDSISIAYTYANVADVYIELKMNKEAENLYKNALRIFEKNNKDKNISLINIGLGKLNLYTGYYENAVSFFKKAVNLSKPEHVKSKMLGYSYLTQAYDSLNDCLNSKKYLQKYYELNDSLTISKKERKISELQVKYETNQIKQKLKYEEEIVKRRTEWLIIFIIAFSAALILSIIVLRQKLKLNNAYQSLVQQNVEIVKAEEKRTQKPKNIISESTEDKTDEELIKKILNLIENEKIYKDKDLSLAKLSELLSSNKTYVSKAISGYFNKHFNTLINEYRIKEAREMLTNPESEKYTIAYVANMVGFKTISVFNSSFKKITGVTPSYYLKTIKKERNNNIK